MQFSSQLIEQAVTELSRFPGVGKKSALRMVMHLLRQEPKTANQLGESLIRLRNEIKFCKKCGNVSDTDICNICANPKRQHDVICVVEDLRDVMAIENTEQYQGVYHVLNGLISPMDGVGPDELNIASLVQRIKDDGVKELIMALSATMEGDTTIFYLSKQLQDKSIKISTISRGIAVGGELEYADEITLGRSIINRVPYKI